MTNKAQQLLARLRESHLVLDREGNWFHEGAPVTHPKLAAALHGWIDRDEETGRYVLRAGPHWCYIDVEDAPYVVRGLRLEGKPPDMRVHLRLSDGTDEELAYDSLLQKTNNVMYCTVKAGRFRARFSRGAYYSLAQRMELRDDDRALLPAAGAHWPVALVDEG